MKTFLKVTVAILIASGVLVLALPSIWDSDWRHSFWTDIRSGGTERWVPDRASDETLRARARGLMERRKAGVELDRFEWECGATSARECFPDTPESQIPKDAAELTSLYRKGAEQENMKAQYAMGCCYALGFGVPQNDAEAFKWWHKAAMHGHASAQYSLGFCYAHGFGISQDKQEARGWLYLAEKQGNKSATFFLDDGFDDLNMPQDEDAAIECYRKADEEARRLLRSAEQGDAKAQRDFAICCESGLLVRRDLVEATKWYRKAAEQGDSTAQSRLGFCLLDGHGIPKNEAEAMIWLHKAADQGHPTAKKFIAENHPEAIPQERAPAKETPVIVSEKVSNPVRSPEELRNDGIAAFNKNDYRTACDCFLSAANQGDLYSIAQYGYLVEHGMGVRQDDALAAGWYEKAAMLGNEFAKQHLFDAVSSAAATSQCNVGYKYHQEKKSAEAAKWYRKAAEQGNALGQGNLGWCYENGAGVPKDEAEAAKWYRKAAEQGEALAQNKLGQCYQNGTGIPKDEAEAVKWYRKAADQGLAEAQNSLGTCYVGGAGISKDEAEAVKWYRKAAEQGDAQAQCNLGVCYQDGTGIPRDEVESVKWCRKAAEQGYAQAQYNLGLCYGYGVGIPKDEAEAVKWYRKAAEQGDAAAQRELKKMGY